MRLTTIVHDGATRVGVLDGDQIRLVDAGPTLQDVMAGGAEALADVARRARHGVAVAVSDAGFGPLYTPPSVRDFSTFEQHAAALAGRPDEWYERPVFYFSNPGCVTGPYDDVRMPPLTTQLDYELEIGVVVGEAGSDLTPEQATRRILGYTIFTHWTSATCSCWRSNSRWGCRSPRIPPARSAPGW